MEERRNRIAIVNPDKCKPNKCGLECKKKCPVNQIGKFCVVVNKDSKTANISETHCISCGICTKVCPFSAITIVNLPKGLEKDVVHRFGPNAFKLHRLPLPRQGQVLGLVGSNGIGKSTAIKILSGKIRPNFGQYTDQLSDADIIKKFRGSELQKYFTKLYNGEIKVAIKPQYVDLLAQTIDGILGDILLLNVSKCSIPNILEILELDKLLNRKISDLSGGELQRFAIAYTISKEANVYIFDEPSSYLDVKQRVIMAKLIHSLCTPTNYVIVIEHDLSILDYLSDTVCCFYGTPSAYGVATIPFNVRDGINIYLDGYIPTENMRFREISFSFKIQQIDDLEISKNNAHFSYPSMIKNYNNKFELAIRSGGFSQSEIIVLLGQNGTGKTSFIKMLAGITEPDSILSDENNNNTGPVELPRFNVSYKPQIINPKYTGTVKELFYEKIKTAFLDPQFNTDVVKPLNMNGFLDNKLLEISGGELQRVALVLCLGKPADIYLIDEPSAYLDSEQRIIVSKIIKQFVMHNKKTAFVVEHDFVMSTYLASKVIVFGGTPSVKCVANAPEKIVIGMNSFLEELDITFRHDETTHRPRINKINSVKDKEQKLVKKYFSLD